MWIGRSWVRILSEMRDSLAASWDFIGVVGRLGHTVELCPFRGCIFEGVALITWLTPEKPQFPGLVNTGIIMTGRVDVHLSDTQAMPKASWHKCCCGLPQHFTHASNGAQVTAVQQWKLILTHSLTLIISTFLLRQSSCSSWNIHGGVNSRWFMGHGRCVFEMISWF